MVRRALAKSTLATTWRVAAGVVSCIYDGPIASTAERKLLRSGNALASTLPLARMPLQSGTYTHGGSFILLRSGIYAPARPSPCPLGFCLDKFLCTPPLCTITPPLRASSIVSLSITVSLSFSYCPMLLSAPFPLITPT
eukprot:443979-Rhodomonas_salina.3